MPLTEQEQVSYVVARTHRGSDVNNDAKQGHRCLPWLCVGSHIWCQVESLLESDLCLNFTVRQEIEPLEMNYQYRRSDLDTQLPACSTSGATASINSVTINGIALIAAAPNVFFGIMFG
jgi:hypothetical protein